MKSPIYVYEPNDLIVFGSAELAARYVEPVDVKNNEYRYFDAEGRVLEAIVICDRRGIEKCVIQESDDGEFEADRLKRIIGNFLEALGKSRKELDYTPDRIRKMNLEQLVKESSKFTSA